MIHALPSHILLPVGQRWKSEPRLGEGEDFEVPVDERLIAGVLSLADGGPEWPSLLPLALGY